FLPADYQDVLTLDEKREYLDRWITMQLLYDEVAKSGMEIPDKLEAQMEAYRKGLIADLLVQQVIQEKAVVHDREVREYYDAHADEYVTEYRVSHILVNSREDAESVKEQIGKRSFTYLARKHSIDKHSRYGGDLGYLSKGNMIPEFEDIVFGMKVGDVSDVIESDFGYHVLKVTEIRDARFKLSYEDVKQEIANNLMLQKRETVYDSLVASIRSRASIRIVEQQLSAGATKTVQSPR
ncbi:MAG: peptidyl-prolyl cis-trans isomerase, partial [bacterium]|nr:peptidyl-prolyl cis-trans isomerase [bacterium]